MNTNPVPAQSASDTASEPNYKKIDRFLIGAIGTLSAIALVTWGMMEHKWKKEDAALKAAERPAATIVQSSAKPQARPQ